MDALIKKTREAWKIGHAKHLTPVTTLGWLKEDGDVRYEWNGACHSSLRHNQNRNVIAVFSGVQKYASTRKGLPINEPEVRRLYLEWLHFHSPFKKGLMTQSAQEADEYGCLIGDPEQPSNLMSAALMSTRIINEHPTSIHMWYNFVKEGLHPSIAFIFAHRHYIDEDGYLIDYVPVHTGCFNGNLYKGYYSGGKSEGNNESYILNFLQNKPQNLFKPYKESSQDALSTFCIWGGPNKDADGLKIFDEVPEVLARTAGEVKSSNPFAKAKPTYRGPKQPLFKDAIELLIPHLNKYKEFFNA